MQVDARNLTIETLLRKGEYEIPDYQREYDWGEDEINDFWNDINDSSETNYFIGHMVFEGKFDDRKFKVIDGQQRITTITILLSVIRDLFYDKSEISLGDGLNDNFIFGKDKDNNDYVILNNKMPYPVLQKYVQNRLSDKDFSVKPTKGGEKSIIGCYDFFKDVLKQYDISKLKKIRDFILMIEIIFVSVSDELDAFTIFETLNAKGKDLSPIDLIKNQIFKNFKKITTLDEPNDTWTSIRENIDGNEINFLNNYWASRYKKVSDIKLYKEFLRVSKVDSFDFKNFIESLSTDSNYFNYIVSPNIDNWDIGEYQIFFSLNALKQFNIKVTRSILLSLIREYKNSNISKSYIIKALNVIEKFHFLNNSISGLRSSGLDTMYAKYSKQLYNSSNRNLKHNVIDNLIIEMTRRKPDFNTVDNSFNNKLFYDKINTKNKKLVEYFLKRIELDLNPSSILLEPSIEHLIPQSDRTISSNDIKNIGNLFLLDANLNSKLGNIDFLSKKDIILKKSTVRTTNEYLKTLVKYDIDDINIRKTGLLKQYYNY